MSVSRPDVALAVRDLSVSYGDRQVLAGLDLDVRRGEVLGVVGASGSGKSTLATALVDAVDPPGRVSGSVTWYPRDGEPVSVLDLDRGARRSFRGATVSVVTGSATGAFAPATTVRTQFTDTLRSHGADVDAGLDRAAGVLGRYGVASDRVLDAVPDELSDRDRQAALVAWGALLDPAVLVLDSPPVRLDLLARRVIPGELGERSDAAVLVLGRDLRVLAAVADRIGVLYAGDVVEVAPTDDLLSDPHHPYTGRLVAALSDPEE